MQAEARRYGGGGERRCAGHANAAIQRSVPEQARGKARPAACLPLLLRGHVRTNGRPPAGAPLPVVGSRAAGLFGLNAGPVFACVGGRDPQTHGFPARPDQESREQQPRNVPTHARN